MGITVHYRGAIDDPQRIEDLEDRVIDFALEVEADMLNELERVRSEL